jgi:hypothetical protein
LHLQLSQYLSFLGIKYINLLQILFSSLPTVEILELLVMAAAILLPLVGFGTRNHQSGGGGAAVKKCFFLLTAPITLADVVMTMLYRWHFNATIHTWLAMRGKVPLISQFSSTKEKSEAMKGVKTTKGSSPSPHQPLYPTQLAVSSLLFMPCVLTLPTTAWYYAFWSIVQLLYHVPLMAVTVVMGLVFDPSKVVCFDSSKGILDVLYQWVHGHVFTIYNY